MVNFIQVSCNMVLAKWLQFSLDKLRTIETAQVECKKGEANNLKIQNHFKILMSFASWKGFVNTFDIPLGKIKMQVNFN